MERELQAKLTDQMSVQPTPAQDLKRIQQRSIMAQRKPLSQ
jgi:hypothetical protein